MNRNEKISVAAVFVLLLMVAVYEYRVSIRQTPTMDGDSMYKGVSSSQLMDMINTGADFILVDVRSSGEYRDGHIPGAVSIPFSDIKKRMDELDRDRNIVLYDKSGPWSTMAYREMESSGFNKLMVLKNGMVGWKWEAEGIVVKND